MKRIGLVNLSHTKAPLVEFVDNAWRIWTAYDRLVERGTYLRLDMHGNVTRVTVHPDYSRSETAL